MSEIEFVSRPTATLVDMMGGDDDVAMAAWVSFGNDDEERLKDRAKVQGLIKFLYRERHMSPFEHVTFKFRIDCPIFVAREFHRHRTMCIDGDTQISFSNGKTKSIAAHWEHWNLGVKDSLGRRRILPSVQNATVVSINESTGRIEHSRVLDVVKGTPKQMFKVETHRGFSIVASADHKFFTPDGWITVKEMVIDGTELMVEQRLADRKMSYDLCSPDMVVSIEPVGVRDSYDLVLDNPHHNFLGNGIVTHNSYNEVSGRYTEMRPRFYVPGPERPLVQQGKAGAYVFVPGSKEQVDEVAHAQRAAVEQSWSYYKFLLKNGVAKEVARMTLPLNLMTQFYATVNARNLMHFLDLRTSAQALYEIRLVAQDMQNVLKSTMPFTYDAWRSA